MIRSLSAVPLAFLLALAQPAVAQEKFVGTNSDVRTVLQFKVSDAAVQALLPAGWEVNSPTSGPSASANLPVSFIDRVLVHDAEGKALDPVRTVALGIPAKKKGSEARGPTLFVSYTTGASGGAYGVSVNAKAEMERKVRIDAAGASTVEESWQFQATDGNTIQFQIQYVRGMPTQSKAQASVYSAVKPDFYRIYRIEQAVDVLRGAGATDWVQKISFEASGPKLASIFNGSEQLISVTSVPWYTRSTHLPSS